MLLAMTIAFMKRKHVVKIMWAIVSFFVIFSMVIWTVGIAFMK